MGAARAACILRSFVGKRAMEIPSQTLNRKIFVDNARSEAPTGADE